MSWFLISLMACGEDPILVKAREEKAAAAASGGAPIAGASEGGAPRGTPPKVGTPTDKAGVPEAPKPGIPEEPKPGSPDEPPPAPPGTPNPASPGQPAPGVPTPPAPGGAAAVSGPKVLVLGTVSFSGWKQGEVRITAFDGPHAEHAGTQPEIIGEARISKPGDFTLQLPENAGSVYIEAAVDEDADGRPGPLDPQGSADDYPLSIGKSQVSGVSIHLNRRDPPPGSPKRDDF